MKIFIMAYARKNLGDDIFIKMLLEKYSQIDFYIKINDEKFVEQLAKNNNLHILIGEDTDEELYKMNVEEYDGYVYIGGSIFMEGGKVYNLSHKFLDFVERCKEKNIPFCYISSNYGPYQTQEYFDLSIKNFKTCTDICFRDRYSYELFKDIENIRYAPDFIFSYNLKRQEKIKNSIGISVINIEEREKISHLATEYHEFLGNTIKKYVSEGNDVYLYSFCEHEGDELIVEKISKEFANCENVKYIKYDGDIEKFLEIYSKMEYMICARFHAMILSCIARQKMFVMSYSLKIDNVIKDLELNLPTLHFDEINKEINDAVIDYMNENNVSAYDEKSHKGIVRRVFTRKSFSANEIMVVVSVNAKSLPKREKLISKLRKVSDRIVSIVLNINTKRNNLVLTEENVILWGNDRISDTLCGVKFDISPQSFFQVNPVQTEKLYSKALEYADIDENTSVMDIYCGIGTISLCAAKNAKSVVGVEIVERAIEDAKENAVKNGIENAIFYADSAENIVPKLIEKGERPDVVILDPPRKGSDESTLTAIIKAQPKRVVYVSCNPATLARDARFLNDNGYTITATTAFDLFPHTSHVETVCLMSK